MFKGVFRVENELTRFTIAVPVLSIFLAVVSELSGGSLWGVNHITVYQDWLQVLLVATICCVSLPFLSSKVVALTVNSDETNKRHLFNTAWIVFVFALLSSFIIFRSENFLLGDGFSLIYRTSSGVNFSYFEKLCLFLTNSIYQILPGNDVNRAIWSYRIISFLAGAIYLFAIWRFARNNHERLLFGAATLTFGVIQVFFGYVEYYALAYACSFYFLLSADRDLDQESISLETICSLALAIGFHFAAVMFLPFVLYLCYIKWRPSKPLNYLILAALFASVVTAISLFPLAQSKGIFVALRESPTEPYYLFSNSHLKDFANLLLLSCPLLLVLVTTHAFWRRKFLIFSFFALLPSLAYAFLIDPKLGALRDWDLLSFVGVVGMAFAIKYFRELLKEKQYQAYGMIAPLFLFALLFTGSWIYLNTDPVKSYGFIKKHIQEDLHYSANSSQGSLCIAWARLAQNEFGDGEEGIRAQKIRLQGDPRDNLNRYNLSINLAKAGMSFEADSLLSGHWKDFPLDQNIVAKISNVFEQTKNYGELERLLTFYLETDGSNQFIRQQLNRVRSMKHSDSKTPGDDLIMKP